MAHLEPPTGAVAVIERPRKFVPVVDKNPIKKLHADYFKLTTQAARDAMNFRPRKNFILMFLLELVREPTCIDMINKARGTSCTCLRDCKLSVDEKHAVVEYLVNFAIMEKREQQVLVIAWMQYALALAKSRVHHHRKDQLRIHLLPGTTHMICRNSLQRLIGFRREAWKTCDFHAKTNTLPTHGLTGKISNRMNPLVHEKMEKFFEELKTLASPRATELVRRISGGTELRNTDQEILELPTYFNRSLVFRRFLFENGWKPLYDNKHRLVEMQAIPGKEQSDLIACETTFMRFWKENFPKLIVQRPGQDICGDCYVFANRHRFMLEKEKEQKNNNSSDEEDEEEETAMDVAAAEAELTEGDRKALKLPGLKALAKVERREELVLFAAKHVDMARKQRLLFNKKKEEAYADRDKPKEEKSMCFVCDYSQNCYVPHFAGEQPGETYYYSPVNAYVFGVADASYKPTKLTAHTYFEMDGKKGANNVASLIWKEFKTKQLVPAQPVPEDHVPVKEINLFFDNCCGQNKNKTVLRMLLLLVKLRVCVVARAVFLVKGHTKNDCDRLFNLMKIGTRKRNIYTPGDLLEAINSHEDIDAIQVDDGDFKDWNSMQERHLLPPKGIKKQHVFTCDATKDGDKLWIQEFDGEPAVMHSLVKKDSLGTSWFLEEPDPEEPVGIQYIKWKELHDKWGPLVPHNKVLEWKYYHEDLPVEKREAVNAATRSAKKQRKGREHVVKKAPDEIDEEEEDEEEKRGNI